MAIIEGLERISDTVWEIPVSYRGDACTDLWDREVNPGNGRSSL